MMSKQDDLRKALEDNDISVDMDDWRDSQVLGRAVAEKAGMNETPSS